MPPVDSSAMPAWLPVRRQQLDRAISAHLKSLKPAAPPYTRLLEVVEYGLGGGGKRVRPVLVLEACAVCAGADEAALPAALAAECVHTFSLIHDDLPAMDDDDLRRGRPTCHKQFGEALAILAGDWLLAHAFELLEMAPLSPDDRCQLVGRLRRATEAMIEGQAADIEGQVQPTRAERVRFIHAHKTAALFDACGAMGAICAGASEDRVDAMAEYGRHFGLAFQIVDDVLDCTGSAETLGKRAGKDRGAAKQTYPAVFGREGSRGRAREEIEAAVAALAPFGPAANRLRELAHFVLQRQR